MYGKANFHVAVGTNILLTGKLAPIFVNID
jgi:hypothetical protein